ncbi:hypothetical protein [Methylotuvimicrobium sp.]|uniref:hypothetical protein n=2 Tax=Methylotuvimicrobium sp. TaxID=2822413 RepID=UPI003D6614EC
MMNTKRLIFPSLMVFFTLSILPLTVQAVSIIDNFSDSQQVMDLGSPGITASTTFLSDTSSELTGIRRTLSAEAGVGAVNFVVIQVIGSGSILGITNSLGSAGTASILWDNFGTVDFNQFANALKLDVVKLDDKMITVEMIVNGTSNSAFNIDGVGEYLFDFSSFSDASLFDQVSSLEMKLTGPSAWDGQFKLSAVAAPVPLPPSIFLMSLALIGFAVVRRNTIV